MNPVLKPGFSSHELKIIKRVSIFSVVTCLVVVTGAWFYNSQKTEVGKKIRLIDEQLKLIEIDITAHQLTATRYLQNGNPRKRFLIWSGYCSTIKKISKIILLWPMHFLRPESIREPMTFTPELKQKIFQRVLYPLFVPERNSPHYLGKG